MAGVCNGQRVSRTHKRVTPHKHTHSRHLALGGLVQMVQVAIVRRLLQAERRSHHQRHRRAGQRGLRTTSSTDGGSVVHQMVQHGQAVGACTPERIRQLGRACQGFPSASARCCRQRGRDEQVACGREWYEHAAHWNRADVTFFQFVSSFMCSPRPFLGGGRTPRSVSTRWNSSRAAVSFTVAVLGRTFRASCRQGTW